MDHHAARRGGPDDTIVFATGAPETGLQRVASSGGTVTRADAPDPRPRRGRSRAARVASRRPQPAFHDPHRTRGARSGEGRDSRIWRAGPRAPCSREATPHATWTAGTSSTRRPARCGRTRFDLSRLETRGAPVEVLRPVAIGRNRSNRRFRHRRAMARWPISRGATSDTNRFVPVWVDREGRETPLPASPGHLQASSAVSGRQAPRRRSARKPGGHLHLGRRAPVVVRVPDNGRTAALTGFLSGRRTGDGLCSAPGVEAGSAISTCSISIRARRSASPTAPTCSFRRRSRLTARR